MTPFYSPVYDVIWEEVKTLQNNGVKVMVLLGGEVKWNW
jgi:hypothetical protein